MYVQTIISVENKGKINLWFMIFLCTFFHELLSMRCLIFYLFYQRLQYVYVDSDSLS